MRHKTKIYIAFLLLTIFGCLEPEDLMTENATTGGLVETTTPALNYVVGNQGPYTLEFFVKQGGGNNPATEMRFYKQFVSTQVYEVEVEGEIVEKDTTLYSNVVLDRTVSITETSNHFMETTYTFDELIEGLEISSYDDETPEPLPDDDGLYTIGDYWEFTLEVVLENGSVVKQAYTVKATVSTRYAGTYKVVDAEYYRLGVLTADENGWGGNGTMSIASIDAVTYLQIDYWGTFSGNALYFQILGDLSIHYPAEWDGTAQTGNGQPLITCELNPGDMTHVYCDDTNYVVNDDVSGKDVLYMSYGYYTGGSGPREFWQYLEKIVE